MRRTLLMLAVTLPLVSACASGGMRPQYDAEAGESRVEQVILQTPEGVRVSARYEWRGRGTPAPAQNALLSFDAYPRGSAEGQWRSNNQLQVSVDGQRARYNGRYSSGDEGGRRHENMLYQIPITDLSVLANATRVEGRIGTREFVLQRGELARLRAFVDYVSGGGQ
jgi:hypothetical protein